MNFNKWLLIVVATGGLLGCAGNATDENTIGNTKEDGTDIIDSETMDGTDIESESTEVDDDFSDSLMPLAGCRLESEKYVEASVVHALWQSDCSNVFYLNVVDADFYDLGHIPGSVEITWHSLPNRLDEVDKSLTIVIYCRKGVRSESAFQILADAEYPQIYIMENGLEAWIAAGYETEPIP